MNIFGFAACLKSGGLKQWRIT